MYMMHSALTKASSLQGLFVDLGLPNAIPYSASSWGPELLNRLKYLGLGKTVWERVLLPFQSAHYVYIATEEQSLAILEQFSIQGLHNY